MGEKPVDIRTVSQDEYWKVFEKRWTSLLSYRYIGRVDDELDAEAFASHDGKIGVRLTLNDEGNEDRTVTSATAMFRLVP